MSTFASRLKSAMIRAEIPQKSLSAKLGVSEAAISQYLSGKNQPAKHRMETLAGILGVSPTYLDGSEPEKIIPESVRLKISIASAARCLGKCDQFVRIGLQTGRLPFGDAVQSPDGRWTYYINPVKFRDYVTPEIFDRYFEMA